MVKHSRVYSIGWEGKSIRMRDLSHPNLIFIYFLFCVAWCYSEFLLIETEDGQAKDRVNPGDYSVDYAEPHIVSSTGPSPHCPEADTEARLSSGTNCTKGEIGKRCPSSDRGTEKDLCCQCGSKNETFAFQWIP